MNTYSIIACVLSILFLIQNRASKVPEFLVPERLRLKETVFSYFDPILDKYNPLDIGSGSPDYPPPITIQTALANAATSKTSELSQYSLDYGHPRLLKAIAKLYSKLLNRRLDSDNNILVTVGATEALYLTFLTYTFPGDEWIVFEPFFDPYLPMIKAVGGVPRSIKLKPKINNAQHLTSADWTFDEEELSSLFNEKTKGILINTPLNPLGKMFTLDELTFIADLARKWSTLVVVDEVYQFITYDKNEHIRIATLPEMFEQTISIGSAGKIFGATGYRIGWAYGSKKLIDNLKRVHSYTVLCAPTPIQEAIAVGLEDEIRDFGQPDSFTKRLSKETQANRDYLYRTLKDIGMRPILPQGGYFMVANWTTMGENIILSTEENECNDFKFAKWLIENVKVFGLPTSSFYTEANKCYGKDIIRFSVIKANETYKEAEKLFAKRLL